jgi:hypothetical protein
MVNGRGESSPDDMRTKPLKELAQNQLKKPDVKTVLLVPLEDFEIYWNLVKIHSHKREILKIPLRHQWFLEES